MGRPLNKRNFGNTEVGPTAYNNEIQVHFNIGDPDPLVGFIVKQKGTRKFVVSETGGAGVHTCVLVAGVEPETLHTGEMLIIVKADDGEVYTVSKIAGHKCTLKTANAFGANIYDGKSVPWNFVANGSDGAAQIEEAGDNDVAGDYDQDNFYEVAAGAPAKITGVILTAESTSAIQITFTAPNDNGFAINNYVVFVDGTVHATFAIDQVAFDEVGRTVVAIGDLAEGTTYAIQVQAVNTQGSGPISDSVSESTYTIVVDS